MKSGKTFHCHFQKLKILPVTSFYKSRNGPREGK